MGLLVITRSLAASSRWHWTVEPGPCPVQHFYWERWGGCCSIQPHSWTNKEPSGRESDKNCCLSTPFILKEATGSEMSDRGVQPEATCMLRRGKQQSAQERSWDQQKTTKVGWGSCNQTHWREAEWMGGDERHTERGVCTADRTTTVSRWISIWLKCWDKSHVSFS